MKGHKECWFVGLLVGTLGLLLLAPAASVQSARFGRAPVPPQQTGVFTAVHALPMHTNWTPVGVVVRVQGQLPFWPAGLLAWLVLDLGDQFIYNKIKVDLDFFLWRMGLHVFPTGTLRSCSSFQCLEKIGRPEFPPSR